MKYLFITLALFIGISLTNAQDNGTCSTALEVENSLIGPFIPRTLSDSSLCFLSNLNMYYGKPHNVMWFTFLIPYDTMLTFDIIPVNAADDFDFILFRADRGDFCTKEADRKIKPVRTNFSQVAKAGGGKTGISAGGNMAYVGPFNNPPYSSQLKVKKGERYYLAVDYYTGDLAKMGDGFMLNIHFNFNQPVEVPKTEAMPIIAPPISTTAHLVIHVEDSAGNPVKASLIIDGATESQSIKIDTTDYSLTLKKNQTIQVRANAKGHMPFESKYTTTEDTSETFLVKMQPIKVAEKISLKDIHFRYNSNDILPESRPALEYLLQFLKNNLKVRIIINGYVNDPNGLDSPKHDEKLSEKRADAVMEYLSNHGINPSRMQSMGYGSSKLLYPHPKTSEEEEANRRVEIVIK